MTLTRDDLVKLKESGVTKAGAKRIMRGEMMNPFEAIAKSQARESNVLPQWAQNVDKAGKKFMEMLSFVIPGLSIGEELAGGILRGQDKVAKRTFGEGLIGEGTELDKSRAAGDAASAALMFAGGPLLGAAGKALGLGKVAATAPKLAKFGERVLSGATIGASESARFGFDPTTGAGFGAGVEAVLPGALKPIGKLASKGISKLGQSKAGQALLSAAGGKKLGGIQAMVDESIITKGKLSKRRLGSNISSVLELGKKDYINLSDPSLNRAGNVLTKHVKDLKKGVKKGLSDAAQLEQTIQVGKNSNKLADKLQKSLRDDMVAKGKTVFTSGADLEMAIKKGVGEITEDVVETGIKETAETTRTRKLILKRFEDLFKKEKISLETLDAARAKLAKEVKDFSKIDPSESQKMIKKSFKAIKDHIDEMAPDLKYNERQLEIAGAIDLSQVLDAKKIKLDKVVSNQAESWIRRVGAKTMPLMAATLPGAGTFAVATALGVDIDDAAKMALFAAALGQAYRTKSIAIPKELLGKLKKIERDSGMLKKMPKQLRKAVDAQTKDIVDLYKRDPAIFRLLLRPLPKQGELVN